MKVVSVTDQIKGMESDTKNGLENWLVFKIKHPLQTHDQIKTQQKKKFSYAAHKSCKMTKFTKSDHISKQNAPLLKLPQRDLKLRGECWRCAHRIES